MKNKIFIVLLTTIFLSGCIKDTLDRKPLNIISDMDVWASEPMMDIYMAKLYDNIIMAQDFTYGGITISELSDEGTAIQQHTPIYVDYGNHTHTLNTGAYSWIRKANYFMLKAKTATIPAAKIKQYIAEARFIRAFYYFDLVKKYGGMPIIEEVQTFDNNLAALQVPRNKEEEVYDYILKELDAASVDLPDSWDANNSNRATKMVAMSLKSRAALYAGSIAKYGTVQLNGLVGIPSAKASTYFTAALNASKAVMDSKKYSLYTKSYDPVAKSGDPIKNYQDIFTVKNNSEVIFQKAFQYPDKGHDWDLVMAPDGFVGVGSNLCPVLELVESYEYIDGTPGTLNYEGKQFDSPDELFKNKDPRCDATILRSNTPTGWGRPMSMWAGIYDTDGKLYALRGSVFPKDPSMLQIGLDGPYPSGKPAKSGFYLRKLLNLTKLTNLSGGYSDQNWVELRLAEVMLNYTEAALELGTNLTEALNAINQIRSRAGIRALTAGELTIDRLRNEKRVELAFEGKRFWDMKRWRISKDIFNNTQLHGLWPYLQYTGSGYKYIYKKVTGTPMELPRVFSERDYYSTLAGYRSTNNNIINNPGW
jgi:hypothetical protein